MNVDKLCARVNKIRPETEGYSLSEFLKYINDLQAIIYKNIISKHYTDIVFKELEDGDEELMVPNAYTDMYVFYIAAQCDLGKGDTARYNNSMTVYNSLYEQYANYINREYMPIQRAKITVGGM